MKLKTEIGINNKITGLNTRPVSLKPLFCTPETKNPLLTSYTTKRMYGHKPSYHTSSPLSFYNLHSYFVKNYFILFDYSNTHEAFNFKHITPNLIHYIHVSILFKSFTAKFTA